METKIKKTIIFLLIAVNPIVAQKTKLDTLTLFQGHWIFKMAMNAYYSNDEIKGEIQKAQFGKIHIFPDRFFGNIYNNEYENFEIKLNSINTEFGTDFYNIEYEKFEKKGFENAKILHQPFFGIYYDNSDVDVPYYSYTFLEKQKIIMIFWDFTKIFLEKDKTEYLFAKYDSVKIYKSPESLSLNKLLKNEEVEVIEKRNGWVKIRYWGKALITGWVKEANLKVESGNSRHWEIYRNNIIRMQVKPSKAIIYDKDYKKSNMYLINGDIIEVLKESGLWINFRFHSKKIIEGWIKKSDIGN